VGEKSNDTRQRLCPIPKDLIGNGGKKFESSSAGAQTKQTFLKIIN